MSQASARVGVVGKTVWKPENGATAGYHNSIYRGKDITSYLTDGSLWGRISGSSPYTLFEDLFVGDYFSKNSITWRIAGFDYWLHNGDTECTTHHIVIVPDENLLAGNGSTTHWMNSSDTTSGAYVGSDFYTGNNSNTGKSQCITMINNAFGSGHILSHREYLKNAVTNGYETGGSWYDSTLEMMTEQMVYGCKVFGNVINGTNIPASYTIDNAQLPLFALDHSRICNRADWWLRDVVSSSNFAFVYDNGNCYYYGASNAWIGVRPAFGIKA